jgi:hypothetical protein
MLPLHGVLRLKYVKLFILLSSCDVSHSHFGLGLIYALDLHVAARHQQSDRISRERRERGILLNIGVTLLLQSSRCRHLLSPSKFELLDSFRFALNRKQLTYFGRYFRL